MEKDNPWESILTTIGIGVLIFFAWNYFSGHRGAIENEGIVKYDDCRQKVQVKENDDDTKGKQFTCNYFKTQSGKIMGGECVNTETENGMCTKAITYEKQQDPACKNNLKEGVYYPYLGYNDNCYTEPQGGETYIDSFNLPVPNITSSSVLPTEVGQCSKTTITKKGTRLTNADGSDVAGSGTFIEYSNSGRQISYDTILSSVDSVVGDETYLCLISVPENCPPGDDRGKVYSTINIRNGKYWQGQDSSHSCGGA